MNILDKKERITDEEGQIVGTRERFDQMNDVTLAYNLGDLSAEELEKVPECFIQRWESWRQKQSGSPYWNSPIHC